MRTPRLRAAASPARVRSRIRSRSNSAIRAEDVEKEPPGGRRGVDRLVEHHEVDAERLQLAGHDGEVPHASREAVELHEAILDLERFKSSGP